MSKGKWKVDFIEVMFVGRKKVSERVVKKNLSNKDLEMIDLLLKYD